MTHNNERDELARDIPTWTDLPFGGRDKYVKLDANAAYAIAGVLVEKGYRKPRQVATMEELDALPEGTLIACVKANPHYPSVFLRIGPARAPWLHLDPSDREDGESTMPSGEVLRWHGNGNVTVLHVGSL